MEKHESTARGVSLLFLRDIFAKEWYSQSKATDLLPTEGSKEKSSVGPSAPAANAKGKPPLPPPRDVCILKRGRGSGKSRSPSLVPKESGYRRRRRMPGPFPSLFLIQTPLSSEIC